MKDFLEEIVGYEKLAVGMVAAAEKVGSAGYYAAKVLYETMKEPLAKVREEISETINYLSYKIGL